MEAPPVGRAVRDPVQRTLTSLPSGTDGDVRFTRSEWTTIRFAGGRIHQPAFEEGQSLSLRVRTDRRLGVATSTDLSAEGIEALVRTAIALARVAPEEPAFPGFPDGNGSVRPVPFSRTTAAASPEEACRTAVGAIEAARSVAPSAGVSGALNVGHDRIRVGNSSGLDRATERSASQLSVLVEGPEADRPASGWSEGAHWDLAQLDVDAIGREAAERMPTTGPQPFPKGRHAVVLRSPAVAEMMTFLAHLGFGGLAELEKSSCLARARGRRLFPDGLTIVDDPRSRLTIPSAIDYEGFASRATKLVDRGTVGPPVADLVLGGRLNRKPTGHGFPPEAPWGEVGPYPTHLLVAAGDAREEELIRDTRRGLLVTRFHYVRTVDPGTGTITGMTRDGTYRIERGEVVGPVRNLRFTESVVSVLTHLTGVGRRRRIHASERALACQTVPAVSSSAFRFTSATVF